MDSPDHLVFVYGTLKIGEPNHFYLDKPEKGKAELIGEAVTVDKWPLVIYSKYNIPFLLDSKGLGKRVHGEIYRVDDDVLRSLDQLEEHPKYYLRTKITVEMKKHDGSDLRLQVWSYVLPNFKKEMLESTFLENYSSRGDHGLVYVESEETGSLSDLD